MDFLDPAKKRAHIIRLYIGYFLLAVIIIVTTTFLVLASYGYDVNRKTGAVIQNGLVFLAARPEPAEIYLNGVLQKNRTDTRLALPAGKYTVELKRSGYRTWKRGINLEGGKIERLVYPVMFPDKLATTDAQLYASQPAMASESPDYRWLLVQQPESPASFDEFDLNGNTSPVAVTVSLPEGVMSASSAPGHLTPVEWSTDNRHLLLEHTFGAEHEFIMLDRETPSASFNVNKLLGVNPTQVTLRDKRFDRLYVYDAATQSLQTADTKARSLTPDLTRVLAFKPYADNQVLYVTDSGAPAGKVLVRLRVGTDSYTLQKFTPDNHYLLNLASYSGHMYIVTGTPALGKTYVYRDPVGALKAAPGKPLVPVSVLDVAGASQAVFSATAQFVAVQSGSHFGVYDTDADHRYLYDLKLPVQSDVKANWMDGDRLTLLSGGNVVIFDFDAANRQTLVATSAFQPFFKRDYTAMYTIASSVTVPSRFALTRTELKLTK